MVAPIFSGVIVLLSFDAVKSFILHHSDDLCQSFTKEFMWFFIIQNHQFKLNIIESMVIARSPYLPLSMLFLLLKCVETYQTYFEGGVKTTKFLYQINLDTQSCIFLLGVLVCGLLFLLLVISDIGFTEDKSHGMWRILKGESRVYHNHYKFDFCVIGLLLYHQ